MGRVELVSLAWKGERVEEYGISVDGEIVNISHCRLVRDLEEVLGNKAYEVGASCKVDECEDLREYIRVRNLGYVCDGNWEDLKC